MTISGKRGISSTTDAGKKSKVGKSPRCNTNSKCTTTTKKRKAQKTFTRKQE
jgi:hypothetical protein